jgi:hypothetical protein
VYPVGWLSISEFDFFGFGFAFGLALPSVLVFCQVLKTND